jgi:tripartite-type tricarboxylate transporter receptor subunit TctC
MRLVAIVAACAASSIVAPAGAADFYAGKTLAITVSSDTGGGYDTYSRLLSRHLADHVPGAPTVIVQNMPGGGGLRSAQHLYEVAPKDGTTLGNVRASNVLDAALGIRGGFDPSKFEWVGNMASDTDVCSFWHTSGIHTFDDLRRKEVIVGASGKSAQNFSFPNAINHILGTKMKIVLGYKGAADRILALERGELQGNCGMNASTLTSSWPQLLANGNLIAVTQSGMKPYPALPNVPMTQSFAKTDEQRKLLDTIFGQMEISRIYAFPPGTPAERVALMRTSFMETLKDPGLIADAKHVKVDLDPQAGDSVAKVVAGLMALPKDIKTKARAAISD